jgi:hypothetical protein
MDDTQKQPPVGGQPTTFRMSREDYLAFEKELLPPSITDTSSILMAGQKLGIQVVLAKFRAKFVQGL